MENSDLLTTEQLLQILRRFNPWWIGAYAREWPLHRSAFGEICKWMIRPPSHRTILLSGARRVGKTTLLYQVVENLINDQKIDPLKIAYISMDHPALKIAGLDKVLEIYQNYILGERKGTRFLMLDEIQSADNWSARLKLLTDMDKDARIIATGSSLSLREGDVESGTGRFHNIKIPTLSFYEFMIIRKLPLPEIDIQRYRLPKLFDLNATEREILKIQFEPIAKYFASYLIRGGFPETAMMDSDSEAQRILREDVVERVLKRDLTVAFRARNIVDIEKLFIYLCMNLGCIVELSTIAAALETPKGSVKKYLSYLEDANLIYKLSPYKLGGKKALKAKYKYYLVDASLANAVLLRGNELFENPVELGKTVETTVFKHIFTRFYAQHPQSFGYWRDPKTNQEVDIIVSFPQSSIPFEIKYRNQIDLADIAGLLTFVKQERSKRAYCISRELKDFDIVHQNDLETPILKIPAYIFCYLCGLAETIEAATGFE
ncbi:MAG: ATP-binding protein [Nitrospira sp.]|nr:ATP-binding protein [Nitrospira sp.]